MTKIIATFSITEAVMLWDAAGELGGSVRFLVFGAASGRLAGAGLGFDRLPGTFFPTAIGYSDGRTVAVAGWRVRVKTAADARGSVESTCYRAVTVKDAGHRAGRGCIVDRAVQDKAR